MRYGVVTDTRSSHAARDARVRRARGARYELSGPESLTQYDKARIIGEVTGPAVRFEKLPPPEGRQAMIEQGLPADVADVLLGYQAATVGRDAPVSPAVRRITGRPGLTFAEWVADHVEASGADDHTPGRYSALAPSTRSRWP